MSLFLCFSQRYRTALDTFDPLKGAWLLDLLDPVSSARPDASPSWRRVIAFILILFLPLVLFSAIPSASFGGMLTGKGSLTADIGLFAVLLFLIIASFLLPIGRRLIGDLINELERQGIVDDTIRKFDPQTVATGKLLRFFEWLSRVNGYRGFIWFVLMLCDQVVVYFLAIMTDANPMWHTAPAVYGTMLNSLSVEGRQPNFAGLWAFVVWGPFILYLMIVIARLIVVFACLCYHVAANKGLNVVPHHPDGIGGLGLIGQAALFYSLFTFALGIDLTGLTLGELVINRVFRTTQQPITTNLKILLALWILYFAFGTALFFIPLLPLRRRMADAKHKCLLHLQNLLVNTTKKHSESLTQQINHPESLQVFEALDNMYRRTNGMAVWPFDRGTLVRYGGLLISPFLPVLGDQFSNMVAWVRAYLYL